MKKTGFAVVRFKDNEDLVKAYKQLQGKYIGSRYIECYLINKKAYDSFEEEYIRCASGYNSIGRKKELP